MGVKILIRVKTEVQSFLACKQQGKYTFFLTFITLAVLVLNCSGEEASRFVAVLQREQNAIKLD